MLLPTAGWTCKPKHRLSGSWKPMGSESAKNMARTEMKSVLGHLK